MGKIIEVTALEEEMTIQETYNFALFEDEAYTGFTVYTLPENPTLSDRVANLESRMTQLENLNYVLVEGGEEGDYAAQLTALETRTSKKGSKYEVLVIKITDKTEKLVFLEPAELELLKISNSNNSKFRI